MYKVGDKFVLEANGHRYDIKIVNVSELREPSMTYACDVTKDNNIKFDDVQFCGDDLLAKCKKTGGQDEKRCPKKASP